MANKRQVNSRQMAFGGILAAVSLVLMLLSSVIPVMSYGLPAIAGFLTTLVVIECGDRMAAVCYGAVSILSVILVPDKESALLYLILFGWYPIVKRHIEKLRKPVLEWALKLVCMAVPVGAASVVAVAVLQFWNGNYENVFLCILSLMLLVIPSAMQLTFQVELPPALEIFILLFIFAAEILGEIGEFYLRFPFWDAVLHTVNGFLCAAIGFSLVTLLNNNQKIVFNLSPVFMAIVAVSFSMTIGVIWEFFEFGMDQIFGLDMQKDTVVPVIRTVLLDPEGRNVPYVIDSITRVEVNGRDLGLGGYLDIGLIDTMQDLLVTFAGSLVFSVLGFFYVKSRGKGALVSRFVPRRKDRDREFLRIVEEEERKKEQSE